MILYRYSYYHVVLKSTLLRLTRLFDTLCGWPENMQTRIERRAAAVTPAVCQAVTQRQCDTTQL